MSSYLVLLSYLRSNMLSHVEEMLAQHLAYLDQLRELVKVSAGATLGDNHQVFRTAVASTLNCTSAIHMYQDHAEVRAGRLGGTEAKQKVSDMFRQAYNDDPGLFLMRRLRAIMAHHTTNVLAMHFSKHRVAEGVAIEAQVSLHREAVVTIKDGVNATVRRFLTDMESDPSIEALMRHAVEAIQALDIDIAPLAHSDLVPAANDVLELWDQYPTGTSEDGRVLVLLDSAGQSIVNGSIKMTPLVAGPIRLAESIQHRGRWTI